MIIDLTNVTSAGVHKYVAEASDLQLNRMPLSLPTTLGNQRPFIMDRAERDADGDIQAWTYRQLLGCITLIIWND